jgi:hypothetical protein
MGMLEDLGAWIDLLGINIAVSGYPMRHRTANDVSGLRVISQTIWSTM